MRGIEPSQGNNGIGQLAGRDVAEARLRAGIDGIPEALCRQLAALAARTLAAPIAFLCLPQGDHLRFRGSLGWPHERLPLDGACGAALFQDAPLWIGDAAACPELRDAVFVRGAPHIRFLGSAPIRSSDGALLGTLCVASAEPRAGATREDTASLAEIAKLAALTIGCIGDAQARLTDFVETSSDWLWETDAEHRFSHFTQLHGIFTVSPPSTFIGKRRWELPGAGPLDVHWQRHIADLDAHQPFRNFEYTTDDADGCSHLLRVSGKPIFAEDGRFLGYRGTASDITAQREAEAVARDRDRLFHRIVETTSEGVWVCDAESRTTYVNDRMAAMLGKPRREIIGRSYLEFLDGSAQEPWNRRKRGITEQLEFLLRRPDGGEIWTLMHNNPIYDDAGRFVGALSMVTDITERKRAVEQLRESEGRFRQIADSVPGILWITDADGNLTFLSKTFAQYTGQPAEQYHGRRSTGCAHPDDDVTVGHVFTTAFRERRPVAYEYRVRRHDGVYRWFLDTCIPRFDDDGRFLGYIGMLTDIEDRRTMAEQLHQAQKMQAVGQLTGGIAHDFNNLLTVILGNVDMLAERLSDPTLRRLAEATQDAAERSAALVQRLLAFSRRQMLQPMPLDVAHLVRDMRELMQRALGEDIDIRFSAAPALWYANADRSQLEAALLNLALNARDAMPAGGRLTIEMDNTEIDAAVAAREPDVAPGAYVMIAVSDTGIGMSEDTRRHAFEPFFTTKDVGKGSGLGLSMIYGFIKQSGGHLTLISEIGRGTTVMMYLPRADAPAARAAARPTGPSPASS